MYNPVREADLVAERGRWRYILLADGSAGEKVEISSRQDSRQRASELYK